MNYYQEITDIHFFKFGSRSFLCLHLVFWGIVFFLRSNDWNEAQELATAAGVPSAHRLYWWVLQHTGGLRLRKFVHEVKFSY